MWILLVWCQNGVMVYYKNTLIANYYCGWLYLIIHSLNKYSYGNYYCGKISVDIPSPNSYLFPSCCCEWMLSDVHSHHQHISTSLAIQSWQQLLLSHVDGIHWIPTHMTMISLHNRLLASYKGQCTLLLWEEKESYTNPDDKGLSLHWYAIETYTGSRGEEAH